MRLTIVPAVCVGHEIVGKAVRVGSRAKSSIKVGDRVGVGAQSASCLRAGCEECSSGLEQHCSRLNVSTYGSKYPSGAVSQGGYANYHRCPSHFVFKIPDGLPSAEAAPMLCGGITMYSPLKNFGCGPGKKVGIVGVGGLGHFGIMFAKALGADWVVGISRKTDKREDVLKMGADLYVATDDDKGELRTFCASRCYVLANMSQTGPRRTPAPWTLSSVPSPLQNFL
jgi:alcohol dehydrogenase (NADP+)